MRAVEQPRTDAERLSPRYLPQHCQDLLFHLLDVGLDLLQRAGRAVLVEVAIELIS